MKYRLIVMDIDDTLIGNDLVISDANRSAIRDAAEAGAVISLASGRMYDSILPFARQLDVSGPIICCQGAAVVDSESGKLLYHLPLPRGDAAEVLRFASERGIYSQYYSLESYFFASECEESRYYERMSGVRGSAVGEPIWKRIDFDPTKILYIAPPPRIRKVYAEARERFGDRLEVAISKINYLEFNHRDAIKGNAVARLAESLGIPPGEVMCIGDGINDLSMIRVAGLGVAMGNGAPELRSEADFVTARREDDGVALAINRFVLGR